MADAPKTDAQIINDAYQDQIKNLFAVLYNSIAAQGHDPKAAADVFAAQIVKLQNVKQIATDALPKATDPSLKAKVAKATSRRA